MVLTEIRSIGKIGTIHLVEVHNRHPNAYLLSASRCCNGYCMLNKSTIFEYIKQFFLAISGCFEATYLRQLTQKDLLQQMEINKARRFLDMFESLDCMY